MKRWFTYHSHVVVHFLTRKLSQFSGKAVKLCLYPISVLVVLAFWYLTHLNQEVHIIIKFGHKLITRSNREHVRKRHRQFKSETCGTGSET